MSLAEPVDLPLMSAGAESPDRFDWPKVLASAMSPEGASGPELAWAMDRMLDDDATSAQVAALVTALRTRGESPDQLRALLETMLSRARLVDSSLRPEVVVDVVGTGGDGSNSVNISTMAALVTAAAGSPVIKHGSRAASSATGSADVLELLGVQIESSPEQVARSAREVGIGFCFAPAFHPALRFVAPTRRELKVPTVFNILGPLANPAAPEAMLVGCSRLESAPTMAEVLRERGVRALVVRGTDGLDEISTFGPTQVWNATGDAVVEEVIDPQAWGIARAEPGALLGSSALANADVVLAVLDPDRRGDLPAERYQAIFDSVVVNAAAALVAHDVASGAISSGSVSGNIHDALPRAREAMESGDAWRVLQRWIGFSQQSE
jgi:anthranilate phosphoribosyltransferase